MFEAIPDRTERYEALKGLSEHLNWLHDRGLPHEADKHIERERVELMELAAEMKKAKRLNNLRVISGTVASVATAAVATGKLIAAILLTYLPVG